MNMFKIVFLMVLLGGCTPAGIPVAPTQEQSAGASVICESPWVAAKAKIDADASFKVEQLPPEVQKGATDYYNAQPPVSHEMFTAIYIVTKVGSGSFMLIYVRDGCVEDATPVLPISALPTVTSAVGPAA